jgi:Helix-turn-helix.
MDAFGAQIGVAKSTISNIENGNRTPTEHMLKTICLTSWNGKYVNDDWLRTGEGGDDNMFIPNDMEHILHAGSLNSEKNEFKKFFLNMMMDLPDEYWNYIYNEFKKFDNKNNEE